MRDLHPALSAAINALNNDVDIDDIRSALHHPSWAMIIAIAARRRNVRSLASLAGGVASLVSQDDIAQSDIHDDIQRSIGRPEGNAILQTWARIAPAAWGAQHIHALRTAVRMGACPHHVATTLIGPCDDIVEWIKEPSDIAIPIRRWGPTQPDNPTWWIAHVSPLKRQYVFDILRRSHIHCASCLPWLPEDMVNIDDLPDVAIPFALLAFADASAAVRAMHADRVQRLIARSNARHLDMLIRHAAAAPSAVAWHRVRMLLPHDFDLALRIVTSVPWRAIPRSIRAAILKRADHSEVCSAIAAARGCSVHAAPSATTAPAFFAALNPAVWNRMEPYMRSQWRAALHPLHTSIAVRSLGPRPDMLAHAQTLSDDLINAVRLHIPDMNAVRGMLFPVAIRALPLPDTYTLLAAMPQMPSDPESFVTIASGEMTPASRRTTTAVLHTPRDVSAAVVAQRAVQEDVDIEERCTALIAAFQERTWEESRTLATSLNDAARAIVTGDLEAFRTWVSTEEAMRRALEQLATLPPAVAIPARCAFVALQRATSLDKRICAARMLAHILSHYSESMNALLRAMRDEDRRVCLQIATLAAPEHAHACERLILRLLAIEPMILPAALLLTHDDPVQYEHGLRMLCASPHAVRMLLPLLHDDMRERLLSNAAVRVAIADLSAEYAPLINRPWSSRCVQ